MANSVAGKYRHRVQLQRQLQLQDGLGRQVRGDAAWQTVAQPWAQIETLAGAELETAKQVAADASHRVTLRGRRKDTPIETTQRLLWQSRVLQVRAVLDEDGTRDELRLLCGEVRTP